MSTETITSMRVNINDGYELTTYLLVSNMYPQNQISKMKFDNKEDLINWLKIIIKEIGNNTTSSTRIKPGIQYINNLIDKLKDVA